MEPRNKPKKNKQQARGSRNTTAAKKPLSFKDLLFIANDNLNNNKIGSAFLALDELDKRYKKNKESIPTNLLTQYRELKDNF